MYNLIMVGAADYWEESGSTTWSLQRFLEYTDPLLRSKFENDGSELLSFIGFMPTLFAYEYHVGCDWRIGKISSPKLVGRKIAFDYSINRNAPSIPVDRLKPIFQSLNIDEKFEISRTHWAIKNVELPEILERANLLGRYRMDRINIKFPPDVGETLATGFKVFLVHGRDHGAKETVARFLERMGLSVIILHERPNIGRTIITKFSEESADVSFAVVLMTADDQGSLASDDSKRLRPRQNVVFEHGFFLGKLGADRVCALISPGIECPSDLDGVVYIRFGDGTGWQVELARELRAAGMPVDLNKLI